MLKDSELARIKDASVDGAVTLDADYIRGFIARLESAEAARDVTVECNAAWAAARAAADATWAAAADATWAAARKDFNALVYETFEYRKSA